MTAELAEKNSYKHLQVITHPCLMPINQNQRYTYTIRKRCENYVKFCPDTYSGRRETQHYNVTKVGARTRRFPSNTRKCA
jgi:hypothetical protein